MTSNQFHPPIRFRDLILGAIVLLLCSYPGQLVGVDGQPMRQAKNLDPHLARVLPVLINKGASLFNDGDREGCCRLFESTLLIVRPALADRPQLHRAIDEGLANARKEADVSDRAFALRAVLDSISREVRASTPNAEGQPEGASTARTPAPEKPADKATVDFSLSPEEQAILNLTNDERKKADVPALKPNEKLFQAARAHSANMARQNKLSHTLDDERPGERIRKAGYHAATWGENCAAGQRTPAEAVSSWMHSEGHRRNILNPQYSEIGIGVAVSEDGTRYSTQVLGSPSGQ